MDRLLHTSSLIWLHSFSMSWLCCCVSESFVFLDLLQLENTDFTSRWHHQNHHTWLRIHHNHHTELELYHYLIAEDSNIKESDLKLGHFDIIFKTSRWKEAFSWWPSDCILFTSFSVTNQSVKCFYYLLNMFPFLSGGSTDIKSLWRAWLNTPPPACLHCWLMIKNMDTCILPASLFIWPFCLLTICPTITFLFFST